MASHADKVSIGLIQMRCAESRASTSTRRSRASRGGRPRRADRLPAGALSLALLLQTEDTAIFDLAEPIPGPSTDALGARRGPQVVVVGSLFERRAAGVYHNTAAVHRCRRRVRRHLPQDAHPRRSAVLREVLLHARRSRLPRISHRVGARRRAGVLGSVVSRRRRGSRRCSGARDPLLPDRDRLAPGEKREYGAAQHDAWETMQRSHAIANGVLRRRGQPRRPVEGDRPSSSGADRSSRSRSAE